MNRVAKRIIILAIWVALTAFYVWNVADIGRSMGASALNTIEFYFETYNELLNDSYGEYSELKQDLDKALNGYIFSQFHDLRKEFKSDMLFVGIITVIYNVLSIVCYHFAFIRSKDSTSSQVIEEKQSEQNSV